MKRTAFAVALVGVALAGCGGGETSSASDETTTTSSATAAYRTTTRAPATTSAPALAAVGAPARNGGAVITVLSVTETDTISYRQSSITTDFGPQSPRPGAKYVVVDTVVLNDGKKSMDLTCSFPIQDMLVTADERQYDTIEDEYKIEGNPGCNDGLQPGFDIPMKYIYEVPAAAEPALFGFADVETSYNKLTWVNIR